MGMTLAGRLCELATAASIGLGVGAVIADGGLLADLEKTLKGQPA